MQNSPHSARMCEIWGSLLGGERRRGRNSRQAEPHPHVEGGHENMNFRKAKPRGASLSRLPTSPHCKRPEGAIPSTQSTQINPAPAAPTQILAPECRQLLSQAGMGAASQLQVCGGSQGEAAPNSQGLGASPQLQWSLFKELEHHVLSHLSPLAVTNLK